MGRRVQAISGRDRDSCGLPRARGEARDEAGLAALAGDGEVIGVQRRIAAGQPQGFRDAQAAAIEQDEYGTVARLNPWRALIGPVVFDAKPVRGGDAQGTRNSVGKLWTFQPGKGGVLKNSVLLEITEKRADGGELSSKRPAFGAVLPALGKEGAEIESGEASKFDQPRLAAEMGGEEGTELGEIAGVGLEGLRRNPTLGFQISEPSAERLGRIGTGGERTQRASGSAPSIRPVLQRNG